MLFLASSTLDKIKQVPPDAWGKIALGILAFIAAVLLLRKLAGVNKILLSIVSFVAGALLFFSWVYHRNEPAFLTPLIDRIAPFFPSPGSYGNKQQEVPGEDSGGHGQPKKPAQPAPGTQTQPATPPSHVY
jgi:hypothetical protein